MLGPLFTPAVDDSANNDWHINFTAEHVAPLSGLVYQLVDGQQEKIDARMYDDRTFAAQCGANSSAGDSKLRNRGVYDTVFSKLLIQVGHAIANIPWAPEPLADSKYFGVVFEQVSEAFP